MFDIADGIVCSNGTEPECRQHVTDETYYEPLQSGILIIYLLSSNQLCRVRPRALSVVYPCLLMTFMETFVGNFFNFTIVCEAALKCVQIAKVNST